MDTALGEVIVSPAAKGGAIIVIKLLLWLISQLAPATSKPARGIVCGTPQVLAEEQRQAAAWALADKDAGYGLHDGGKFYSKDEARGAIAAWRAGARRRT